MKINYKELTLLILFTLSGVLFWIVFRSYVITHQLYVNTSAVYPSLLTFAVFALLHGLSVALIDNRAHWLAGWAVICSAAFLIVPSSLSAGGALLLYLAGFLSFTRARTALTYSIGKTYYIPIRKAYPWMLTAFSLLVSIIFVNVQIGTETSVQKTINTLLPEEFFVDILRKSDNIIASQLPEYDTDISFSDYIMRLTEKETGIDTSTFSSEQRYQIVDEAKKELEIKFNISIDKNWTLGELLYHGGIAKFDERVSKTFGSAERTKKFFPYIAGIGFFLVLRSILFPVGIFLLLCIVLIIRFLIHFHLVTMKRIERIVEYPVLL